MPNEASQPFPAQSHDHGSCVDRAMARARQTCLEKQIKLTPLRESILREIAASHRPIGAYDIIERLGREGRRLAPISVYRIIDLFLDAGLIHRVESRNAFFICSGRHETASAAVVLLCEDCGRVAETEVPEAWGAIARATAADRFIVKDTVLEVKGICADCNAGSGGRARC